MAASQSDPGPEAEATGANNLGVGPFGQIAANAVQSFQERLEAIKGLIKNISETNETVRATIKSNSEAIQKHLLLCEAMGQKAGSARERERILSQSAAALDRLFAENRATQVGMLDYSAKNTQILAVLALGAVAAGAFYLGKGRE